MDKKYNYIVIIMFMLFCSVDVFSQRNFKLINNIEKQTLSFKLLSNLIVFPIKVNGKELNFILDSGVGSTILFNIKTKDSINLKNVKKIYLQGLGKEEPIEAMVSNGNEFRIKNIRSANQKLYIVSDEKFDLSSKMGITIHGIIGFQLLKDFAIKVNYNSKRITFYNSETYKQDNCRRCETFNLEFYKLKPYINVGVKLQTSPNKIVPVKLLIDSGGSDAMWLFEHSKPELVAPTNYFDDFLGEGLSGAIYGKRSKIEALVLGKFQLKNPTVSYPDSLSIMHATKFKARNGSLGGSILERFIVTYNYKKNKITLKKGAKFKKPFRYNMSGIELVYNGKIMVKEPDNATEFHLSRKVSIGEDTALVVDYKYTFKQSYKIGELRLNSPAYNAGLLKDDIIIKINGRYAHELKFEEIIGKFYQKEFKNIALVIERNGQDYEYSFKLKDMLK